jgi:shikimate dehydrogenase
LTLEPTFTLDDLSSWTFDGVALAVLGFPVRHSLSPAMHNAALAALAAADPQFARWRYFRFEVRPEDLAEALPRFMEKKFFGLNLTVPHKIIAVDLVSRIDPPARQVGAVNTLRLAPDGYDAFNTDGYGLARAVEEELGASLSSAPVVLLGAGGAARAAAVECLQRGCPELWIGARDPAKAAALLDELTAVGQATAVRRSFALASPPGLPDGALVINATSAGLKPDDASPLASAALPAHAKVFDMIYNPAETPLMQAAAAAGLPAANGLAMLVYQGERALAIWSQRQPDAAAMARAARHGLAALAH